ncbi:hypothetical protein HOLleu_19710 [Holothuria leucospilota]|uniref:Uncharacterized protein n=1 Tax=Holothuria leucospilota TaxID=206669 RepID=A0A9Q1H7Z9_HOLLE|nr:hypothetical protein HOLleu_19710 [Holothuria leucospilota]
MQPVGHQQLVFENQPAPAANPGVINNQNPDRRKWGWKVRNIMGILQITFGVIEIVFGIAAICIPMSYYDSSDNVGWGIWNGVFAIVTGFLGVYSKRRKCMWRRQNRAANLAVYSILCIVFALQMLMSILGASFTCRPVCSNKPQQQVVYYYVSQAPPQQTGPVPPSYMSAPPPPQYNAPYGNAPFGSPPLQYTTPTEAENIAPSKTPL